MKFSLNWLRQDLDTDASVDEIAETLTMIGLEIEGIENPAEKLKDFVVGHVTQCDKHPDADRLKVCQVDNGTETVEVVCGAPNARQGMRGVFAASGCYIPGIDTKLKKSKIRGVVSNGMLLSEREMGLSDEHEGIVELADDAPIGASAVEVMGLDDCVFDIAITPNRGDCLGVRGIARDLAAAGIGTLKPLEIKNIPGRFKSPISVHLDFDADTADACPYFVGRYIKGVKNEPSPQWLQDKLLQIGLRPISTLVDITNLMTIALDRPLHVFDADKVRGDMHVRLAKSDEKLLALDDKEYTLDTEMTVIADEHDGEALGGVMGGLKTGCTEDTVNVFVESAYFDPVRTAATGRKLNLQSDARFRFERGIDPEFLVPGMELATSLIIEMCGGKASELVIAGAAPDWQRTYTLRPDRVQQLGGIEISAEETIRILTDLGFTVTDDNGAYSCAVPSWRHDVVGEADLVEEVVRIHGYGNIPAVPLTRTTPLPQPAVDVRQERRGLARRTLAARGLTEAVTFSFLPSAHAALFGDVPDAIKLVNPISADLDVMRPSILPNLIAAAGRNADRGYPDLGMFEVGPQFAGENPDDQTMVAAGIRAGNAGDRSWTAALREIDVFDIKADVMAALDAIGAPSASLQITATAPDWYHPGRAGSLQLGPNNVLANFGEIHPAVLRAMDVAGPVVGFELFIDRVPLPKGGKGPARAHLELPAFQPVERDFAFIVEDQITADAIARAASNADRNLITDVNVFDLFTGDALGGGKKSVAISVILQATDATLTEAAIEAVSDKIVAAVAKQTGGVLRG